MEPHQRIAALPIELESDDFARFRRSTALRGNVQYAVRRAAFARISYGYAITVGSDQGPDIAGLSATQGIEERPIKLQAFLVARRDSSRSRPEIGILAKEQTGHRSSIPEFA